MTQDERLDAALARLTAAVSSLEVAAGRIPGSGLPQGAAALDPSPVLEHAISKIARLEAANEAVSRALKIAIEDLAAILARRSEASEDRIDP